MSETTTKQVSGPYLEGKFLRKYGEPGFYRVEIEVDSPIADAYPEAGTRVDLYPWTNDDRDEQIAALTAERDALKAKLTRGPARLQETERIRVAAVAVVDSWNSDAVEILYDDAVERLAAALAASTEEDERQ